VGFLYLRLGRGRWVAEVRELVEGDFDEVIRLGRAMHAESSFASIPFSDERGRALLRDYLRGGTRSWFVVCVDGVICGFFAGYVSPYFFSDERVAHEILWFVTPEHRKSGVGLMLLDAFETWAKSMGVSEIRIGYSTDVDSPAFERLMLKRGYSRMGGNYRLENSPC